MPVKVARVPVESLSCCDCDCRGCMSAAIATINSLDGVVYVGVERRRPMFIVRYDSSRARPEAIRSAVGDAGLRVMAS